MQVLIGTRANINIATIEDDGGETCSPKELAINLLPQGTASFKRCRLLSKENELPSDVVKLAEMLLRYLMHEHVNYAIDLGLQAIPIVERKAVSNMYFFFEVVQKSNTMVHLLEGIYKANIIPSAMNTPKYSDCMQKKRFMLEDIENRLDTGLDRTINAVIGWVKVYLQAE